MSAALAAAAVALLHGGRQEVRDGHQRHGADGLRAGAHGRQPEGLLRRRVARPLQRLAAARWASRRCRAEALLWGVRVVLLAAVAVHIHAAYQLTMINRRARPRPTAPSATTWPRTSRAGRCAGRGSSSLLFVIFHLLDLTWGPANPDFVDGDAVPQPRHELRARAGGAGLHRRQPGARRCTSTTARGACSRAWAGCCSWRRAVRDRLRGGDRDRQRLVPARRACSGWSD